MLALLSGLVIASSQGAPISLGPGSFSYPDLAKALTKAGMTTDVSASLRDRAAYVHLKARTPQTVREVLTETLGVSFSSQTNGSWRIVPDPEVQKQERRFNAEYRRVLAERFERWVAPRRQFAAGRPYQVLVRAFQDQLESQNNGGEDENQKQLVSLRYNSVVSVTQWALMKSYGTNLIATLPKIERTFPFDLTPTILRNQNPERVSPNAQLILRGDFKPVDGVATFSTTFRDDRAEEDITFGSDRQGRLTVGSRPMPVFIPLDLVSPKQTFAEMSPAATAYEASFGKPPTLDDRSMTIPSTSCLSAALEAFKTNSPEAVFELSVFFDHLPDDFAPYEPPKSSSLRSLFTPVPRRAGWMTTDWPELTPSNPLNRNEAWGEHYFPWRVRLRNGVLEAFNLYRFLDREIGASPIPYLQAENYLKTNEGAFIGSGGRRFYSWPQFVRLARIFRNTNASESYRDIDPSVIQMAGEYTERIEALPGNVREAIWKSLAQQGSATFRDVRGEVELKVIANLSKDGTGPNLFEFIAQEQSPKLIRRISFPLIGRGTLDRYLPK